MALLSLVVYCETVKRMLLPWQIVKLGAPEGTCTTNLLSNKNSQWSAEEFSSWGKPFDSI